MDPMLMNTPRNDDHHSYTLPQVARINCTDSDDCHHPGTSFTQIYASPRKLNDCPNDCSQAIDDDNQPQ